MRRTIIWITGALLSLSWSIAYAAPPAKSDKEADNAKLPLRDKTAETIAEKTPDETTARISSKVDVEPTTQLTDNESREVAFAAGRILKHVAQARDAVADQQYDTAAKHVDQGLKLIQIINNVLPHYSVKTEIKAGDIVYSDDDEIVPSFVTLFDELDRRDIVTPVLRAKKEVEGKAAEKKAESKKDGNEATTAGKGTAHAAPIVSLADIEHTTIKLDVRFASRMLAIAKQDLAAEDHQQRLNADAALLTLQAGAVMFEYEEIDLPLEQAADNLKLAEAEMKAGRHREANQALRAASDELKQYEKSAGESRAKEVRQLHQEIEKLTTELAKGKPTDKQAEEHSATIANLWQRVTKWFKNL